MFLAKELNCYSIEQYIFSASYAVTNIVIYLGTLLHTVLYTVLYTRILKPYVTTIKKIIIQFFTDLFPKKGE